MFDLCILISIMMIFFCISPPISWAADVKTSSQDEDIVTGQESSIKGKLHQKNSCLIFQEFVKDYRQRLKIQIFFNLIFNISKISF